MSFLLLPDEIVLHMVRFLPASSAMELRRCCRRLLTILTREMRPIRKSVSLWHDPPHTGLQQIDRIVEQPDLCALLRNTTEVSLYIHVWDDNINKAMRLLDVTHLSMHEWIPPAIAYLPRIKSVTFRHVQFTAEETLLLRSCTCIHFYCCLFLGFALEHTENLRIADCVAQVTPYVAATHITWWKNNIPTPQFTCSSLIFSATTAEYQSMTHVTDFLNVRMTNFAISGTLFCRSAHFQYVRGAFPVFARVEELCLSSCTFESGFTACPSVRRLTFKRSIYLPDTTTAKEEALKDFFPHLQELHTDDIRWIPRARDHPELRVITFRDKNCKDTCVLSHLPCLVSFVQEGNCVTVDMATVPMLYSQ